MFTAANAIPNARKVPLFLTVIGPTIFSLLHDMFQPDDHTIKSYDELVTKLKEHFNPKPVNVLAYRYTFHWRNQTATETLTEYMAELRRLAALCEFGDFLNDALRDRLVFGIQSDSTQHLSNISQHLLRIPTKPQ